MIRALAALAPLLLQARAAFPFQNEDFAGTTGLITYGNTYTLAGMGCDTTPGAFDTNGDDLLAFGGGTKDRATVKGSNADTSCLSSSVAFLQMWKKTTSMQVLWERFFLSSYDSSDFHSEPRYKTVRGVAFSNVDDATATLASADRPSTWIAVLIESTEETVTYSGSSIKVPSKILVIKADDGSLVKTYSVPLGKGLLPLRPRDFAFQAKSGGELNQLSSYYAYFAPHTSATIGTPKMMMYSIYFGDESLSSAVPGAEINSQFGMRAFCYHDGFVYASGVAQDDNSVYKTFFFKIKQDFNGVIWEYMLSYSDDTKLEATVDAMTAHPSSEINKVFGFGTIRDSTSYNSLSQTENLYIYMIHTTNSAYGNGCSSQIEVVQVKLGIPTAFFQETLLVYYKAQIDELIIASLTNTQAEYEWDNEPLLRNAGTDTVQVVALKNILEDLTCSGNPYYGFGTGSVPSISVYTAGQACVGHTNCNFKQLIYSDYTGDTGEVLALVQSDSIQRSGSSVDLNNQAIGLGVLSLTEEWVEETTLARDSAALQESTNNLAKFSTSMSKESGMITNNQDCSTPTASFGVTGLPYINTGNGEISVDTTQYVGEVWINSCPPIELQASKVDGSCPSQMCTDMFAQNYFTWDSVNLKLKVDTTGATTLLNSSALYEQVLVTFQIIAKDGTNTGSTKDVNLPFVHQLKIMASTTLIFMKQDLGPTGESCYHYLPRTYYMAWFNQDGIYTDDSDMNGQWCEPSSVTIKYGSKTNNQYYNQVEVYSGMNIEYHQASQALRFPFCTAYTTPESGSSSQVQLKAQCTGESYYRYPKIIVKVLESGDADLPYSCSEILKSYNDQTSSTLMYTGNDGTKSISYSEILAVNYGSSSTAVALFTTCTDGSDVTLTLLTSAKESLSSSESLVTVNSNPFSISIDTSQESGSYYLKAEINPTNVNLIYTPVYLSLAITICSGSTTISVSNSAAYTYEYSYDKSIKYVAKGSWTGFFTLSGSDDCINGFLSTSESEENAKTLAADGYGMTGEMATQQIGFDTTKLPAGLSTFYIGIRYSDGSPVYKKIIVNHIKCEAGQGDFFKLTYLHSGGGFVDGTNVGYGIQKGTGTFDFVLKDIATWSYNRDDCKPTRLQYYYSDGSTTTTVDRHLSEPEDPNFIISVPVEEVKEFQGTITVSAGSGDRDQMLTPFTVTFAICDPNDAQTISLTGGGFSTSAQIILKKGQSNQVGQANYYVIDLKTMFIMSSTITTTTYTKCCGSRTFSMTNSDGTAFSNTDKLDIKNFQKEVVDQGTVTSADAKEDLVISTGAGQSNTVLLKSVAQTGATVQQEVTIIVCGDETIVTSSSSLKMSLTAGQITETLENISSLFTSSFTPCPVTEVTLALDEKSQLSLEDQAKFIVYDTATSIITVSTQMIQATWPNSLGLTLSAKTTGEVTTSIDLTINLLPVLSSFTISDEVKEQLNSAPIFDGTLEVWEVTGAPIEFLTPPAFDGQLDEITVDFNLTAPLDQVLSVSVETANDQQLLKGSVSFIPDEFKGKNFTFPVSLADSFSETEYTIEVRFPDPDASESEEISELPDEEIDQEQNPGFVGFQLPEGPAREFKDPEELPSPTLEIEGISPLGELSLAFNQEFLVPESFEQIPYSKFLSVQLLSSLDDSVAIGTYVSKVTDSRRLQVVNLTRDFDTENCNTPDCASLVKYFEWEVLNHTGEGLKIQLYFDDTNQVSTSVFGQDVLKVDIVDPSIFVSALTNEPVKQDQMASSKCGGQTGRVCKLMPPLLPSKAQVEAISAATDTLESGVAIMAPTNLLLTIILGGSVSTLFGMVRLLQIIMLGAVIEVVYPAHLNLFYQQCVSLAQLDILQAPTLYEMIFTFRETEPLTLTFEQFEIGDLNFFMNSGSLLLGMFIVVVNSLFWQGVKKVAKRNYQNPRWRKIGMHADQFLPMKNPILKLFVETYIDVVLSAFLGAVALMKSENWSDFMTWLSTFSDFLNTVACIACLAMCFILPFMVKRQIESRFRELELDEVKDEIGIYYEDFRTNNRHAASYNYYMMLRRLIMMFILVEFCGSPAFQTKLFILLSLITYCALISIKPYADPATGRLEMINETTVFFCTHMHHAFMFSTDNSEATQHFRNITGWAVIMMISLNMMLNIALVGIDSVKQTIGSIQNSVSDAQESWRKHLLERAKSYLIDGPIENESHDRLRGLVQAQNEEKQALLFCKAFSKERRWCLSNGLDVSLLPEEAEFRRLIQKYGFKRRMEQVQVEKELWAEVTKRYKRVQRESLNQKLQTKFKNITYRGLLEELGSSSKDVDPIEAFQQDLSDKYSKIQHLHMAKEPSIAAVLNPIEEVKEEEESLPQVEVGGDDDEPEFPTFQNEQQGSFDQTKLKQKEQVSQFLMIPPMPVSEPVSEEPTSRDGQDTSGRLLAAESTADPSFGPVPEPSSNVKTRQKFLGELRKKKKEQREREEAQLNEKLADARDRFFEEDIRELQECTDNEDFLRTLGDQWLEPNAGRKEQLLELLDIALPGIRQNREQQQQDIDQGEPLATLAPESPLKIPNDDFEETRGRESTVSLQPGLTVSAPPPNPGIIRRVIENQKETQVAIKQTLRSRLALFSRKPAIHSTEYLRKVISSVDPASVVFEEDFEFAEGVSNEDPEEEIKFEERPSSHKTDPTFQPPILSMNMESDPAMKELFLLFPLWEDLIAGRRREATFARNGFALLRYLDSLLGAKKETSSFSSSASQAKILGSMTEHPLIKGAVGWQTGSPLQALLSILHILHQELRQEGAAKATLTSEKPIEALADEFIQKTVWQSAISETFLSLLETTLTCDKCKGVTKEYSEQAYLSVCPQSIDTTSVEALIKELMGSNNEEGRQTIRNCIDCKHYSKHWARSKFVLPPRAFVVSFDPVGGKDETKFNQFFEKMREGGKPKSKRNSTVSVSSPSKVPKGKKSLKSLKTSTGSDILKTLANALQPNQTDLNLLLASEESKTKALDYGGFKDDSISLTEAKFLRQSLIGGAVLNLKDSEILDLADLTSQEEMHKIEAHMRRQAGAFSPVSSLTNTPQESEASDQPSVRSAQDSDDLSVDEVIRRYQQEQAKQGEVMKEQRAEAQKNKQYADIFGGDSVYRLRVLANRKVICYSDTDGKMQSVGGTLDETMKVELAIYERD